jgi:hypothetical protein
MHQNFVDDPDMEHLIIDSTIVRAHPCAARARKKRWSSITGPRSEQRQVHYESPCEREQPRKPSAVHTGRSAISFRLRH